MLNGSRRLGICRRRRHPRYHVRRQWRGNVSHFKATTGSNRGCRDGLERTENRGVSTKMLQGISYGEDHNGCVE